jgi:hypothetical protein
VLLSGKLAAVHHDNRHQRLLKRISPHSDGALLLQPGQPGDRPTHEAAGGMVEQP